MFIYGARSSAACSGGAALFFLYSQHIRMAGTVYDRKMRLQIKYFFYKLRTGGFTELF